MLLLVTLLLSPAVAVDNVDKGEIVLVPSSRAPISPLEFAALVSLILYFLVGKANTILGFATGTKWRSIITAFPTYQMWRGAYTTTDHATLDVCGDASWTKLNSEDGALSEFDMQQCYQQIKSRVRDRGSLGPFRDFFNDLIQSSMKLLVIIVMLMHARSALEYSVYTPQLGLELTQDKNCFRQVKYAYSQCHGIIVPRVSKEISWNECVTKCIGDPDCGKIGMLGYNFVSRHCTYVPAAYPYCTANADDLKDYIFFQRVPCRDRTITSCGDLLADENNVNGQFSNGNTEVSAQCPNNQMGAVCSVRCRDGYTTDDVWGNTAICGISGDGNLRWIPHENVLTWNPGQDMCVPDQIQSASGLEFHLKATQYSKGTIVLDRLESTLPLWKDPVVDVSFSVEWAEGQTQPESLGPQLVMSHLHALTNGLYFEAPLIASSPGAWLSAQLNYDRIRQSKHLAMFAVIDPTKLEDWYRFTSIFNLERVFFADDTVYGSAFVKSIENALPPTGQWAVVTVLANVNGVNAQTVVRVNGYPLHPEGYRTIPFDCTKDLTTTSCAESATSRGVGLCTPSDLFCSRSVQTKLLSSSATSARYVSDIGRSFNVASTGASTDFAAFNGFIGEVALMDTQFDVRIDDSENLRKVEAIEWFLATKYRIRGDFVPIRPPKPLVRPSESSRAIASFPEMMTVATGVELELEMSTSDSWSNPVLIPFKSRTTYVFLPEMVPHTTYYIRINARPPGKRVVVHGFPTQFTF